MGDLHEDHLDQYLRFGTIQVLQNLIDLQIRFFVGDHDNRPSLRIDFNQCVPHLGVVQILPGLPIGTISTKTPKLRLQKLDTAKTSNKDQPQKSIPWARYLAPYSIKFHRISLQNDTLV